MKSGQVVSRDGTRIAYDRQGDGPPVVLVVGALCSRALGPGVKLAPLLAAEFTVFTYDRRGRGDSGDSQPYAVEREVDDLAALIQEAGGSALVFGHSSGALLALRAAAHGLPIRKLALYEAPLVVDDSREPLAEEWVQIARFILEGRRSDALKVFLKAVGAPGLAIAVMRCLPVWRKISAVAHTLPYDGALTAEFQQGEPLPPGIWANVTVPALALAGGKSPLWMQNAMHALVRALPNSRLLVLAGQTHDVAPKALAPVLAQFFNA